MAVVVAAKAKLCRAVRGAHVSIATPKDCLYETQKSSHAKRDCTLMHSVFGK